MKTLTKTISAILLIATMAYSQLFIVSETQLRNFAVAVNDGNTYEGQIVMLGADIELTSAWSSIGSNTNQFRGTFDGNGKTISNLRGDGLFGTVGEGGQIKNLTLNVDSIISGGTSVSSVTVGALAIVYNSTKPIENCGVNIRGRIGATGSHYATSGGLVGSAGNLTIINSFSTGNISSSSHQRSFSGGLVGWVGSLVITNSFSTGNVSSGSSGYTGGLVGNVSNLVITNSFSTGNVAGGGVSFNGTFYGSTGGLAGGNINNSINQIPITATITNSFYNSDDITGPVNNLGTGRSAAQMRQQSTFVGWDFVNVWEMGASYPILRSKSFGETSDIWNGMIDITWYNPNAQAYNITTAEQLAGLAFLVNEGLDGAGITFFGKRITLGADIFLNDTTGSTSENFSTAGRRTWTPIGFKRYTNNGIYDPVNSRPFEGEFDGVALPNNRKIYGLYISNNTSSAEGLGLFGYSKSPIRNIDVLVGRIDAPKASFVGGVVGHGAVLRNVNSDIKVIGGYQVGGVAGIADEIRDSRSSSVVIGDDNVGGLLGMLNRGRVENSFATGNVSGDQGLASAGNDNIGGLIGFASNGNVSWSWASGNVSGTTIVGGLIGRADTMEINHVYARGNVSAVSFGGGGGHHAGGLIGYNGSGVININEAYSTGLVSALGFLGGFMGMSDGTLNLTECYFDQNTSGQSQGVGHNNRSGVVGKSTAEMKRTETFAEWDFVNVWGIDPTINNGYPFLRGVGDNIQTTSINNARKSNNRHGIRFAVNPVSDQAEISVILPDASTASAGSATAIETNIVIYDMVGNVVFSTTARGGNVVWNLQNTAGRFVANGTYLVIAEAKDRNGNLYRYSAKLGVKR